MNYKNKTLLENKMKTQIDIAQSLAEKKFIKQQKDAEYEKKIEGIDSKNKKTDNNEILNKLNNIEKLLKELVDINYTALHLVINDSEKNKAFFKNKQEK